MTIIRLAEIRELVFIIDGSEVGQGCITLMISLLDGKRALPITWGRAQRDGSNTISVDHFVAPLPGEETRGRRRR